MKNTATLATLAAGLSQVAATGFGSWGSAPAFNCPANTDNKCTEKQIPGFNWKDLPTGPFESYGGFNWKGFTCENKFSKRDELAPRTFGFQDKCISGVAHHDHKQAPNFGCNGKDIEKTSIGGFQVTPEFDCDLEFHYGMPDGSTCKHRTPCKKSGTYVQNSQCGGAKNVTVVVPKQPAVPKETCNFGFHSITFDCASKSSTVPPKPSSTHYQASSASKPVVTTSSSAAVKTPASSSASVVVSTSAASSASTAKVSTPVVTSSSVQATTSSVAVVTSKTNSVPQAESSTVATPSGSASKSVPVESPSKSVPAQSASTHVTTYMTTSTLYSTSVHTVTSCGPEVPNCPASSTQTTVVTVPVGTTVCPVTETHAASSSKPVESAPGKPTETAPGKPVESAPGKPTESAPGKPVESAPGKPVESAPGKPTESAPGYPVESGPSKPTGASSTGAVPATSSKPAVPAGPVETLPCPAVVPSCLNTWMFSVGCKDNTDAACYCPDSKFTKAIYECMAAHGDSQETIADAIEYFKGICAPFIPTNPGIATGADHLTYITAKPTPVPSASYTTISVIATTVVPVTDEAGAEVTSSSSTVTISTTMTVPQIAITTGEAGAAEPSVGVVPGTYKAQPAPTATAPAGPTGPAGNNGGAAPYPTTMVSAKPTGATGAITPSATANPTAPITAGAGRVGSGIAFGAFIAAVAIL
ncbi:adhesin protein Mad1 [Apiospora marii]|uniref:Adhesin protein Mad1 n=1 Tax=Apiospora marii TaxID=335849 RepID=A0ABR1SF41_9PEZI